MRKICGLIFLVFLLVGCATTFIPSMDGVTDVEKIPQKTGTITKSKTYWSVLFLKSPNSMRKSLYEKTLKEAKSLYGDDVRLTNLDYKGEWNPLSLIFYLNALGQVQDVTLKADIVKYVDSKDLTDKEIASSYENGLSTELNEFTGTTFIRSSYIVKNKQLTISNIFTKKNYPNLEVYIGKKDNKKWLRVAANYEGSDWIFYENIYLLNGDSDNLQLKVNYFDKIKEVLSKGNVTESSDDILSDENGEKLLKLLNGKQPVKVRLLGKYYKDYELDKDNVDALINILNYYYNSTF